MNNNYKKLEKCRYAKEAASQRWNKENKMLDYKGNNLFKLVYRKLFRIMKERKILKDDKFYIGYLAVATDYTCNLNCRGCGQHTPEIKKISEEQKKIDILQIFKDLDKISQAVDGIGGLALANGEGFLNKNLEQVMDYYHNNPKILSMNVPTNGTVIPNATVLDKMSEYGVSATITRYEVVPEQKREALRKVLRAKKIRFTTFENRKWQYHEYCPELSSTEKETCHKYYNCERFFMLLNGELWKCVTDATRVFAGLREKREGDSLVVQDATVEEVRDFLEKKANLTHLESCYHCRGGVGSMVIHIPAGEQIK